MELGAFFKSVIDQDRAAVVICDLCHTIIYMNPSAVKRYKKDLTGKRLLDCHGAVSRDRIEQVVEWFKADAAHNIVYTFRNEKENKDVYMVALRDGDGALIGYYEKHEYRTNESMKLYDLTESSSLS